jgi:hypothetical protein
MTAPSIGKFNLNDLLGAWFCITNMHDFHPEYKAAELLLTEYFDWLEANSA